MFTRLITYIKNEELLLQHWLDHHLSIVPGWCIHVIDNDSTDSTPNILKEYKKSKGINLHTHNDYKLKGEVVSTLINRYKNQPGVTIPLDGDEFLILYQNNQVNKTGLDIRDYINKLPTNTGIFETLGCLNSIPEQPYYDDPVKQITKFKWKWQSPDMCKKFYSNQTFKSTDHGNHHGLSNSHVVTKTEIALLHYHDTGMEAYKARCEQDIDSLGIDLDIIKQQLIEGNQKRAPRTFPGHEKVNSYLNIKNWVYESANDYDVMLKKPL